MFFIAQLSFVRDTGADTRFHITYARRPPTPCAKADTRPGVRSATLQRVYMKKHLFVLLACLFVVMIGFGITLPVLPFYVQRLALAAGAPQTSIVLHVTLVAGVYSLMQLVFAPVWGRWSDRVGRRPLILIGIAGYVVAQVMFGLATCCGRFMRRELSEACCRRRPCRHRQRTSSI